MNDSLLNWIFRWFRALQGQNWHEIEAWKYAKTAALAISIIIATVVNFSGFEAFQIAANEKAKLAPMVLSKNIIIPHSPKNIKVATVQFVGIVRNVVEYFHHRVWGYHSRAFRCILNTIHLRDGIRIIGDSTKCVDVHCWRSAAISIMDFENYRAGNVIKRLEIAIKCEHPSPLVKESVLLHFLQLAINNPGGGYSRDEREKFSDSKEKFAPLFTRSSPLLESSICMFIGAVCIALTIGGLVRFRIWCWCLVLIVGTTFFCWGWMILITHWNPFF
jgi:hypothetical protein